MFFWPCIMNWLYNNYQLWCTDYYLFIKYCSPLYVSSLTTRNSHREWQYHILHVYNCIFLKMNTWGSKHVEENIILWINNNQCIKLVINIQSIHDARSEKHQVNFNHNCILVLKTFTLKMAELLTETCWWKYNKNLSIKLQCN